MPDDPRVGRSLVAILPGGRVAWLEVGPAPASAASLDHVALLAEGAARRRHAALRRQRAGIVVYARLSAAAARHVSRTLVRRRRRLRRRVRRRALALDRRLSRAREVFRRKLARRVHVERESVRRLHRRDLWDKAVLVTALPLFAAYRQKGRPLAEAHVALLLSTLLWLVGDDVVDTIFGPDEPSPYAVKDLDVWSYIAPVASLLGGYWLLSDFQHERFVGGSVHIPPDAFVPVDLGGLQVLYRHAVAVDLGRAVAPGHLPDLQSLADVPAVATIGPVRFTSDPLVTAPSVLELSAQVLQGLLVITFDATATLTGAVDPVPPVLESLEVAWMVDTRPPTARE